jgi:hypothetical protein
MPRPENYYTPICPECQYRSLRLNGKTKKGNQRLRCSYCGYSTTKTPNLPRLSIKPHSTCVLNLSISNTLERPSTLNGCYPETEDRDETVDQENAKDRASINNQVDLSL